MIQHPAFLEHLNNLVLNKGGHRWYRRSTSRLIWRKSDIFQTMMVKCVEFANIARDQFPAPERSTTPTPPSGLIKNGAVSLTRIRRPQGYS